MLKVGDPAPDFTLPADDGSRITLSDLRGKRVVLYFYPKDNTSGCTAQACEYRDALPRFADNDVVVLGVSPDPIRSHEKFRDKFDLNFPLLADEDHVVSEAYGVWQEKSMYGKTYMGIVRSTFVIDETGVLQAANYKVKAKGDAEAVAQALGV